MRPSKTYVALGIMLLAIWPTAALGQGTNFCGDPWVASKDAEGATSSYNTGVYGPPLDFDDTADYDNATRGFIGRPADPFTICKNNAPPPCADGEMIWDLEEYKKYIEIDQPGESGNPLISDTNRVAPASVNPSLWRNAQLNMLYGLFRVAGIGGTGSTPGDFLTSDQQGIYQVRGYDLSNITFVKGTSGWIVFDPLISPETAKAALDLINTHLGVQRAVVAVVYSHSHVDHYGGAPGLFADPANHGALIIAPEGFTEHAVSENVIAGNAMGRRAIYMYGALLPRNEKGGVNGGLGQTTSTGEAGLLLPTHIVQGSNEHIHDAATDRPVAIGGNPMIQPDPSAPGVFIVDGVRMAFQSTPGTEAPAEMNTWFPDLKALWMAENTTNTLHNILTLRGAQVRDARKWAAYLNETIVDWGSDAEVKFQSHHWPLWDDTGNIVAYLEKQRDIYKFIHDQTVRLMNNGYTGEEISEVIEDILPTELASTWADRGYYGTLRHNSRAVYQYYMGWYDGHPSDLNNLPPVDVGTKYMEYMTYYKNTPDVSEKSIVERARQDFVAGQYRWVAEIMKHAVFSNMHLSDSERAAAKALLADALEQLGYQAESGPWRSVYLQGAFELRNCVPDSGGTQTATPDTIRAMTPEMVFDFLAVHLCPVSDSLPEGCVRGAAGETFTMHATITDLPAGQGSYTLTVGNSVLNYFTGHVGTSGVQLEMEMDDLYNLLINPAGGMPGDVVTGGDSAIFQKFQEMLDLIDNFWFPIITAEVDERQTS